MVVIRGASLKVRTFGSGPHKHGSALIIAAAIAMLRVQIDHPPDSLEIVST